MSHEATKWAFEVRGVKPIAWRVLAHLANCHNPVAGCFPSQAYLADVCEVSRASINRHLDELELMGLIRREQRSDKATNRQQSTRYYLAFEKDFAPLDVASRVSTSDTARPESRVSGLDTENREQNEAFAGSRVSTEPGSVSHSFETLTGKEPLDPPPPKPSTLFEGLLHIWPVDKHGNVVKAEESFMRLDGAAQRAAHRAASPAMIGMVRQKRTLPKLQGYLDGKLFDEWDGAPPVDADGDFIITPDRPEWRPWLGWLRTKYGDRGVESAVKAGKWLPKTRWPEGHPNVARKHGNG